MGSDTAAPPRKDMGPEAGLPLGKDMGPETWERTCDLVPEQTDTYENITSRRTTYAGGKNRNLPTLYMSNDVANSLTCN